MAKGKGLDSVASLTNKKSFCTISTPKTEKAIRRKYDFEYYFGEGKNKS
jgi:hypothetical protein